MKQFFKMFFASLLAMIVGGVILAGVIIGMIISAISGAKSGKNAPLADASILVIETDKRLHEQGEKNSFAAFSSDISYNAGLYDAIRAIRHAGTDNDIKGILLKLDGTGNGWATLQQLRDALTDFKKSGKKVYAYGEGISQKDYFLGSAADVLYLNPVGQLELKGLASQVTFFKGALDRLQVQPEIFYAGKFKSATEPFRAEKMSDANRTQITEVLNSVWSRFLMAAAEKTKSDTAYINGLVQRQGIHFATEAAANRLVDGAKYLDELEDLIRPVVGVKAGEKIPYLSLDEYTEHAVDNDRSADGRIAVLFAEGEIVDGKGSDYQIGSEDMVKIIRQIGRNDKIRAVVMRVNSPGGSALASEVILRELQLLRQKKPLIISMGDVAASGGYYISSGADSVFALPNTITGSIGVFSMLFNLSDLMKQKLGVTFDGVKTAPYADFPTVSRPLSPDEQARMQASVDTIYATFKNRVVTGRHLNPVLVDSIAQGRIWTGTAALGYGLVNGLGSLDRALQSAAAKAGLKEYGIVTYPEPVDEFKSMLRKVRLKGAGAEAVQGALKEEMGPEYEYYREVQSLRRLHGRAQMSMPFRVEIN